MNEQNNNGNNLLNGVPNNQNMNNSYNFDPNTGEPLNKNEKSNKSKKGLILIFVLIFVFIVFLILNVKVLSCHQDMEEDGVELTSTFSSVSFFDSIVISTVSMELDFSELDDDLKESYQETYIEEIEESYGESNVNIQIKEDKIIVKMTGYRSLTNENISFGDFEDEVEDLGYTCK